MVNIFPLPAGCDMVRAQYLTPESIIVAMQAGNFYVSNIFNLMLVNFKVI
jgi:hypothetical protein